MKSDLDFKKKIKGEIFFAGSMAYLLEGKNEKLNGPLSEMWLDAWRMSYTDKLGSEATVDQIREIAESYSNDQMPYVENLVQSKFYEILESTHENMDGDKWSAKLFEDPAHPGTDVRFYNSKIQILVLFGVMNRTIAVKININCEEETNNNIDKKVMH